MGRNNTRAAKSIAKMYEQLGLPQDDIFHKTKLLLSIYRDVVWATLSDCRCVNAEINYYGDDLNDALIYLEEFAPDIERSEFEHRVCNLFENKWMIENADKVMDLSYAMLEKHIADQEELPDNTDVIRRKQGEIEKLMNKRTNLIEMRAEGDIDKEMFRSKKQEIEDRVAKLTEEIKGLQPEKEQTSNEDYSVKLLELRERLKEYTGFDYSVIPESIVEAFIERIWVSKDEFRWYLRTGNNADGEFDPDDHIKIGAFTLTIDDAKKYIYSFSTRRRVYKWSDLNVSVWI